MTEIFKGPRLVIAVHTDVLQVTIDCSPYVVKYLYNTHNVARQKHSCTVEV